MGEARDGPRPGGVEEPNVYLKHVNINLHNRKCTIDVF